MVKRSRLKQGDIAEKLGISRETLRRYQQGSRPMPVDLYWKLVLITKFYIIIPLALRSLNRYWHSKWFKRWTFRKTDKKRDKKPDED